MARAVVRDLVFGLAATGLLMGCVEGGGKPAVEGAEASAAVRKGSGTRDVEAPEVYQTTDSALWDGRPSLGGIWVAAPDVVNPERALIFNPATGKSITGALFKRERDNPGPRLQLSSDAAEALGILAGQPTEIRVTALRKEEVAAPAPAPDAKTAAPAPTDAAAAPGAAPAGDKAGGAAAVASAALDAVDAGKSAPAAPPTDPAAAPADGGAAVAVAPEAPAKPKTWKERRAEAKAAREAKRRAAAEAKAAAAAAAAGVPAATEAPTATPDAAAAAMAPIESAPLDARTPGPSAPDTKTAKRKTVGDTAAAAPAAAPTPAPAPAASGTARPIQVASFSKEENAARAAEALAKIGITATPQKSDKAGKAVWGVVVMGDDAMLKKIKDAGFADAYYLK